MHEEPPAPARVLLFPTPVAAAVAPAPAGPWFTSEPSSPEPAGHDATTIERGSFCLARCTCGWSGPARRSRDRARTDAAEHLATP